MSNEDWEEKLIDQMIEMFQQMGIPMDRKRIKSMMEQFRSQFETMGIDPEKLNKEGVNFNIDMTDLSKLFNSEMSPEDLFKNMGIDVKVDAAPVEINPPDVKNENDSLEIEADDIYLEGWNMYVTLDFTMKENLEEETDLDLALISEGQTLEVMKTTQVKPVAIVNLPHQCDDLVDWTFNNGILDITLKLTPQGSATPQEEFEDDDGFDDDIPLPDDVSVDFGKDDDDEDDGGIPII